MMERVCDICRKVVGDDYVDDITFEASFDDRKPVNVCFDMTEKGKESELCYKCTQIIVDSLEAVDFNED